MSILLKFYNEKCTLEIPVKYDKFKSNLCSALQFPHFNELVIYYIDSDGDKIIVGNEMDFEELKKQINTKEVKEIEVEIIEGSKLKFPNFIQNELSKEVKANSQPFIMDQKKSEVQIEKDEKVNPNDLIIKEQPKLQPQQIEKKMKELPPPMKKNNEIVSNPQNIIDQNPSTNTNQQMKQKNINDPNPLLLNNIIQKQIAFNVECSICHENPIKTVLYLCQQCNMYLCSNCEKTHGPNHHHPLLKIRKPENIPHVNVIMKDKEKHLIKNKDIKNSSILDSIKQIPNAIKNLFHDETKDPKYLMKVARSHYELSEISDDSLLKAINKTKGNIDEAVILLAQEK